MMQPTPKQYRDMTKKLSSIGYICQGSVGKVYTVCGNDYCPCAKDPNAKHGPYFLWTRKENAKTVSKRLDKNQVALVKSCMKNYGKMKNIIEKMKIMSEKAIFQ